MLLIQKLGHEPWFPFLRNFHHSCEVLKLVDMPFGMIHRARLLKNLENDRRPWQVCSIRCSKPVQLLNSAFVQITAL